MNLVVDEMISSKGCKHFLVSTNAPVNANMPGEIPKSTPAPLLGLIEKADFFVTNYFHVTIFPFLLQTDFLTFVRDAATDKQNLLLTELLESLALEERYCDPTLDVADILKTAHNARTFDGAAEALATNRSDSVSFLTETLEYQIVD